MYNEWMTQEVKELTAAGRIKRSPYILIAEWVKRAWDDIDIQLIKHSFKCCGISIATDGSEDHLLFDYDQVENNEINEHDQVEDNEHNQVEDNDDIFAMVKI